MNALALPTRSRDGSFHVVVESPRGSPVKLRYDPELEAFTISRPLVLGLRYPFDWGFVPSTRMPDGDPLDAMVLSDVPTYPGVVLRCHAVGVVQLNQDSRDGRGVVRNDRLIAVPYTAPRFEGLDEVRQLPERFRRELEQFFLSAVLLTEKRVALLGWGPAAEAEALVDRSRIPPTASGDAGASPRR
jgi:inorganic pyrophosphatase